MTFKPQHFIFGLALLAITACSGKSPEQLVSEARQYAAEGNYAAATIELKNALLEDDTLGEARWLLGDIYMKAGDAISAEKELVHAQKLGWNADNISPVLARARLTQGKFAEVLGMNSGGLNPQAASTVLASQAVAEIAQGNPLEAEEYISLAFKQAPNSLDAKMAEARLMASQSDYTGALIVLEEILAEAPDLGRAWSLKGDILVRGLILPEAVAAFSQAIALQPNTFNDRLKRSMANLQSRELAATQADVTLLLETSPRHPTVNYVQGLLHFKSGQIQQAITALSLAEPVSQQFPMVLFYLSRAHLLLDNPDRAADFAEQFFAIAPGNMAGRKLLAAIHLRQGASEEISKLLLPVLDKFPDDVGALSLMANAFLAGGDTEKGLVLLRRVVELSPNSPTLQVRLGAGLLMAGQGDESTHYLEKALDLNPKFQQADILLVLNHLQNRDFDAAIAAAMDYREQHGDEVVSHGLLGKVYLEAGMPDEARESFNEALSIEPGDPSANHSLALMAISEGDLTSARHHYEIILEHSENYLPALVQMAQLEAMEKQEDAMVRRLEQAMEAHPTALQPRLLLGRYYLGRGKHDRVAPLFATLSDLQKESPQVLQLLALAQLSGGQNIDATHTLEQLIAANPDTAYTHHLLAMAADGSGDKARAKQELEQAIALDGNYAPSLVALARIALQESNSQKLDFYLTKLTQLAPNAPEVLAIQASAAHRAGDTDAAIALATRTFQSAPNSRTLLALAAYQAAAGNTDQALQLQQNWIGKYPKDMQVRLNLASGLKQDNQPDKEATQYESILEENPNNVTALNNLAWNLRLKDLPRAESYIRQAAKLAPNQPEVQDTLAVIEYLKKDYQRAHRAVRRALAIYPEAPSMLYHRAMIEAAMGKKTAAQELLKNLLSGGAVNFPEREEARALLSELEGT